MRSTKTDNTAKQQTTTKKNKTNDLCISYLKTKWRDILTKRFVFFFDKSPQSAQRMELIIDCMIKTLESLFLQFSDLKDTHFNNQIMSSDTNVYSQRMAEMLFYYQLRDMGFKNITSKNAGPDFMAEKNGEVFCFEVVTPTPSKSISDLIERSKLTPEERNLKFRERLLSVTSAIQKKLDQFKAHKLTKKVPEGAHYIIVVNDSLLLPYNQPWYGVMAELCFGDSTLPIIVDATLGSEEIDFTDISGKLSLANDNDNDEIHPFVMRHNIRCSINGVKAVPSKDSYLPMKMRKSIPSRMNTNTILVDIAESVGVAGIYQITLREDLMFLHSFESIRPISPPSALVSSVKNKNIIRSSMCCSSTYAKDEPLIQPVMSPARLLGYEPHDFNSQAIYSALFEPFLEGGEFYKPPESQD